MAEWIGQRADEVIGEEPEALHHLRVRLDDGRVELPPSVRQRRERDADGEQHQRRRHPAAGRADQQQVAIGLTPTQRHRALLVRVVADGLTSVSRDTLAAAAAMGYTGRQRLFAVQLPIAVPVIGAG